jgi:hypothetical protein
VYLVLFYQSLKRKACSIKLKDIIERMGIDSTTTLRCSLFEHRLIHFYEGTTKPGQGWTRAKKKKHGVSWVGKYQLGFYKDHFKLGKMKNKGQVLRQVGKVEMLDVSKGVIRSGGGCHMHYMTDKDTIGVSSAGCQCVRGKEKMQDVYDICAATGKARFDYLIMSIEDWSRII